MHIFGLVGGEDLCGVPGGVTVIRIYYIKNTLNIKGKKQVKMY